jgi:hypothetical protein
MSTRIGLYPSHVDSSKIKNFLGYRQVTFDALLILNAL